MIILPAVDIKDGRCVRLRQGKAEDSTIFYDDPSEAAVLWDQGGAQWIHVVDLDGAFAGVPKNLEAFKRIAGRLDVPFEVGGGIRTMEDIEAVLKAGASRVILGTKAVEDIAFLDRASKRFPGKVSLGIDAKDGLVATKGWTKISRLSVFDLLDQLNDMELASIIYTDISKDGMMIGPNIETTAKVAEATRFAVVASGGVSSLQDIINLSQLPIWGIIVGRALYDGAFTLPEAITAALDDA